MRFPTALFNCLPDFLRSELSMLGIESTSAWCGTIAMKANFHAAVATLRAQRCQIAFNSKPTALLPFRNHILYYFLSKNVQYHMTLFCRNGSPSLIHNVEIPFTKKMMSCYIGWKIFCFSIFSAIVIGFIVVYAGCSGTLRGDIQEYFFVESFLVTVESLLIRTVRLYPRKLPNVLLDSHE